MRMRSPINNRKEWDKAKRKRGMGRNGKERKGKGRKWEKNSKRKRRV